MKMDLTNFTATDAYKLVREAISKDVEPVLELIYEAASNGKIECMVGNILNHKAILNLEQRGFTVHTLPVNVQVAENIFYRISW
jgi:hypothetical protein